MDAFERPPIVSDIRPQPFGRVDMNFSHAIPIIVPRPFMLGMTHGGLGAKNVMRGLPLIGLASGVW